MLTKQQRKDSEECELMQEQGEDKECFTCSCSVCIAQIEDRLERKGIEITKERLLGELKTIERNLAYNFQCEDKFWTAHSMLKEFEKLIERL